MAGLSFCIDEIVKMRIVGEEPVILLRGAAAIGEDGRIVTHGKNLHSDQTKRNFGLNKIMYKHDMNREEVKKLPQIIREYLPVEETERGLKIYVTDNPSGNPYVVATNMKDGRRIVSSMYRDDNNPYRAFSNSRFEPMSERGNIKIRAWNGAVFTVPPEKLADALKAGGQIIE